MYFGGPGANDYVGHAMEAALRLELRTPEYKSGMLPITFIPPLVPEEGVEPTSTIASTFEEDVYANSTTLG